MTRGLQKKEREKGRKLKRERERERRFYDPLPHLSFA